MYGIRASGWKVVPGSASSSNKNPDPDWLPDPHQIKIRIRIRIWILIRVPHKDGEHGRDLMLNTGSWNPQDWHEINNYQTSGLPVGYNLHKKNISGPFSVSKSILVVFKELSFLRIMCVKITRQNSKVFLINIKSISCMRKRSRMNSLKSTEWSSGFPSCSWPIVCKPSWNVRCTKEKGYMNINTEKALWFLHLNAIQSLF